MAGNGGSLAGNSLTQYQAKKQEYIFDLLYDTTHDRNLSRQDFTKLQKIVMNLCGLSGRCEVSRSMQARMAGIWSGLMKSSKHYRRNPLQLHLSVTEWLCYWSDFVRAAKKCRGWPPTSEDGETDYQWHQDFIDLTFDFTDHNNDGTIDQAEYTRTLTTFGVDESTCRQAFEKITSRMNGHRLDKERFRELWFEFITSDNPEDVGNFLFGDPMTAS